MKKNGDTLGNIALAAHQNIQERDYWLNQLAGTWDKTRFPYDYRVRNKETGQLESLEFEFPSQTVAQLLKLSRGIDHTLHMILTAGLILVLNKFTGINDVIVGTPVYKQDIEPSRMINTALVLRNRITGDMSFKDLLLHVRDTILKGTENYRYPLDILAKQLGKAEESEGFPLFETGIILENIHDKRYFRNIPLTLLFSFLSREDKISGCVTYDTTCFLPDSITGILSHFTYILNEAIASPDAAISQLSSLSEQEKNLLLEKFNGTIGVYPEEKTIFQLFEEQVESSTDRTALIGLYSIENGDNKKNGHLSYRLLNQQSNRMAHFLRSRGVTAGTIVAIMVEPCLEMIIGILGILKAGGAYLPIDPATPSKRLVALLEDSHAGFFLISDSSIGNLSFVSIRGFAKNMPPICITPTRAQEQDLDSLQIPNRSLINYEQYRPYIGQAMVKNSITIHMSRGCVYNCAYCFKIWPRKYVLRSAENVFQEINLYYQMGIRRFAFVDDLPNINVEESSKLYRLIIQKGLKVHLHFPNGIRGDILTPDYIDLMVEAGTITMDLALETTSPRLQKLVRKNLNLKRLEENIRYIAENHPQVILELQILHGIPSESEEEARDSLDFIKRIKWVHFPYIHVLNIYPNSDMAKIALSHGISREAIERSADLAYHELPETLPFTENFTRKYQAEFLNEYFMNRDRLLAVLPYQMKVLTEDELVQKYNSYLPVEIKSFADLLDYAGISRDEIDGQFLPPDYGAVAGLNKKMADAFPQIVPKQRALRVLLLDLTQYFTHHTSIRYDVVEPPLGLLYLLTHLHRKYGDNINGKIAKSRMDFDSYEQLHALLEEFKPQVIGIRTLNFYKDFFHETVALIKLWFPDVPIVAGGPYATSNTTLMLKDPSIDLAVLGEGENTFAQLIGRILENNNTLPGLAELNKIPGLAFRENTEQPKVPIRDVLNMKYIYPLLNSFPEQNPLPVNHSTDLAYIIYTSGSTGIPKGVLIQHNHLVNQLTGLCTKFGFDSGLNYLLLTAYTFDVSVMHIFTPLITGAKVHLIDDETRKNSLELWRYVIEKRIDILNIVPAYMKILLQDIAKKQVRLQYLFVGGDVFDNELYTALNETFAVERMINIYGPTETTINAALCMCTQINEGRSIPIGKPLMNYRAYIVDENLALVPIGAMGELCIGGASVSRGYLNRPELTAEKFISIENISIAGEASTTHLSKTQANLVVYRTGDQVRWLPDGNIEFLGRIDRQIKIRGFRIELGEIELQLLNHKSIKEAIVLPKESRGGDRYLCAYIIPKTDCPDATELKAYLQGRLPNYMVPTYFVFLEKFILTSGGKPDKKALPDPEKRESGVEYVPPRNKLEMQMVNVWAEVMSVENESIGIDTNFFELGGHSLKATILISRMHKQLNIKIPLVELFKTPTIRGLSQFIGVAEEEVFTAINSAEKREYYPLSSAQKRLFFVDQMIPDTTAYNMSHVVVASEPIDQSKLELCFQQLIKRHEGLRTEIVLLGGEPVQKIKDAVTIRIANDNTLTDEIDSENNSISSSTDVITQGITQFIRPFDLTRAPLFRVGLITISGNRTVLIVDMHHIITDGVSHELLAKDMVEIYEGKQLHPLKLQYTDYSQWQTGEIGKSEIQRQESWWLSQFKGDLPSLELPLDNKRPQLQRFDGDRHEFVLTETETDSLKTLASQEGATLFMVLLSIFDIFISKISGSEDVIVGTPVAARRHVDLKPIIGMFVNTLALRGKPRGKLTYREFLQEIREFTLQAFENQEYPFEDLVEGLAISRDTGRNPLFDVMFTLFNMQTGSSTESELNRLFGPFEYRPQISKFDLTLFATENEGKLRFNLEYSTLLFKEESIEQFIYFFKTILSKVLVQPGIVLGDIEIVDPQEKKKLLEKFNATFVDYPRDMDLDELVVQQVEARPDDIALFGDGLLLSSSLLNSESLISLTYRELHERSTALSYLLQTKGVRPGSIVAVMLERSIDMVIVLLAILKAGAAYLPISPATPESRKKMLFSDTGVQLKITRQLLSDEWMTEVKSYPDESLNCRKSLHSLYREKLAYITYTSGSTGLPKGVMVEHRNIVRLVCNNYYVQLNNGERILPTGALEFDASTFEIWGALVNGFSLCLMGNTIFLDAAQLKVVIDTYRVDTIWMTSPLFNRMVEIDVNIFAGLKNLLVGGDVLSPMHINRVIRAFPQLVVINGYGPTENTTFSTTFVINKEYSQRIPIGKPIANSTAFIVDTYKRVLPVGIPGELLVGGDGVARGYLNNPELTSERFFLLGAKDRASKACILNFNFKSQFPYHPVYSTGDLARWLMDGTIEFLGRKDRQVKVRGYRIELGEIQQQLVSHPLVTEAVVIIKETGESEKYICTYIVAVNGNISEEELRIYLKNRLPDYMIPSFIVLMEQLPLTPGGKIDISALPAPGPVSGKHNTAPGNEVELQLARIWKDVLSLETLDGIDIDSSFFVMGGHSLKAVTMIAQIHRTFNVKVPLAEFFNSPTIRALGKYIPSASKSMFSGLETVEKKEYYPLSFNQKRLFFLQQMEPDSASYNMPAWLLLTKTDPKIVKKVLAIIMERHEGFRTRFGLNNNEPVQFISPSTDLSVPLEFVDISEFSVGERKEKRNEFYNQFASAPFDLEAAPLFRSQLVKIAPDSHELFFNMHHIMSDGWSLEILEKEFYHFHDMLNTGKNIQPESLKLQYKDYALWQNRLLADDEYTTKAKAFWRNYLGGSLPILNLPHDEEPAPLANKKSASCSVVIPDALAEKLRALAQENHASLFMTLLTGINLLLSRVTGQQDVVMAIPAAARQHEDLKNIIGMFVNTLILKNSIDAAEPFSEFFRRLQVNTLHVLEFQSYPMELICSDLGIRYPEISVFFNMVNIGDSQQERVENSGAKHHEDVQEAKFEWVFYVTEYINGIKISCHYFKELFNPETIEKILNLYVTVLENITLDPKKPMGDYNIIGKRRKRLLK